MKVYKYILDIEDEQTLDLPKGARVLSFHAQKLTSVTSVTLEYPCIWALVDPDEPKQEMRTFRLAGTGHPIDIANLRFVGTALFRNDTLVLHLFEKVAL